MEVQTSFACGHSTPVAVDIDGDVAVPSEVKGLGKCAGCMEETNLIAISGVQPGPDGDLALDSIFLMPVEG